MVVALEKAYISFFVDEEREGEVEIENIIVDATNSEFILWR